MTNFSPVFLFSLGSIGLISCHTFILFLYDKYSGVSVFEGLRVAKFEQMFDPYTGSKRPGNAERQKRIASSGSWATIRKITVSRIVETERKKPENLVNMGFSGLFA